MKNNILVSICIPAYNGEHLIFRAIESCLNQTYTNLEIVIVDDCSSDNTIEIIKNFQSKDQRIKFFRNESNLGVALNFFETFKKSSGEYVQHLGQDDWLDKNYIEKKLDIFIKYPEAAFVSGPIRTFETRNANNLEEKSLIKFKKGFYDKKYVFENFYKKNGLIGLFCMARRKDIIENFMIDIPNKYNYDIFYKKGMVIDNIFLLKILTKYRFMYYESDATYNGLSHEKNASKQYNIKNEIKFSHIDRIGFEYFFINYYPSHIKKFRIFKGADILATIILHFLRINNLSFSDVIEYFKDYSFEEKLFSFFYMPIILISRILKKIKRIIF